MMLINKIANVQTAAVGDRVVFTLQVTNNDAFPINSVQIMDILPPELKFVEGSLTVNVPSWQGSLNGSILLGTLAAGCMASVRFEVDVVSQGDGTIANQATGSYSYQTQTMPFPACQAVTSQVFELTVINPTLLVTKAASKTAVKLGDVFYFTITLNHLGDAPLSNILVQDVLNPAFELLPETVTVNNQVVPNPNLTTGISVPNINGGGTAIISFAVKVKGGSSSGCIMNIATVRAAYSYPTCTLGTRMWTSNPVRIYVGITNFKQMTLDSNFNVPCHKPDMEDIAGVNATVEILDSYVVPTASGVSNEGQILTGNKLVVNGVVKVIVTYTALTSTQDMHAIYCEIPFGTFIVMPVDYREGYRVEAIGVVEKATYAMEGPRKFYVNIALLIKAAVLI